MYDKQINYDFKKIIYSLVLRLGSSITFFIFLYYIGNKFGNQFRGQFFIFQTSLRVLTFIGIFGLGTASIKIISKYLAQNDFNTIRHLYFKISKILIVIFLIILILLIFFMLILDSNFILSSFLDSSKISLIKNILPYLAICLLPTVFLAFHSEIFRSFSKNILFVLFNNNNYIPFLTMLLSSVFFIFNLNSVNPLICYSISVMFMYLLSLFFVYKTFKYNFTFSSSPNIYSKDLLSLSKPMFLSTAMFMIMQWIDIFCIFSFLNEQKVDVYKIALAISSLNTIIIYSVNSITVPKFSKYYYAKNNKNLEKSLQNASKLITLFSIPLLLFIFIFSNNLVSLLSVSNEGSNVLRILILGQLTNSIAGPVGFFLLMTGKEKIFQKIVSIALIINIILNITLIPDSGLGLGIIGAAYATMISLIFWNLCSVIYIYKEYKIISIYNPLADE